MRALSRVASLSALLLAAALSAAAQEETSGERILSFLSEIEVRQDGSLEVRETIRARAANDRIRHGIYRDFPTRYEGRASAAHVVPFAVTGAERDGRPERWHTAATGNGVRVYLGDRETLVEPGDHDWVLSYRTDRQLGYFDGHDELYWNVTGNGWTFAIDAVEARVTLPSSPAAAVRLEAYAGEQGSQERAHGASWDPVTRTATFRTTRGLGPNEGFTVVAGWPKGVVREPTASDRLRWRVADNRSALAAFAGVGLVICYYLVSWIRVGRDPKRGVVVTYDPPRELPPAAMRYLRRAGFDPKTFAAALVQMAVKGHLIIEREARDYTLRRGATGGEPLAPFEAKILDKLFGGEQSVALVRANHARVGAAAGLLQSHLQASIDRVYLVLNRGYLAAGVGLSLVALAATIVLEPPQQAAATGFMSLWLLGWSAGVGVLVVSAVRAWRGVALGSAGRSVAVPRAVILTLFTVPFVLAEVAVLGLLVRQGSVAVAFAIPVLACLGLLFHFLLQAPTASGRTLLDRIEGFERYLSATGADRLNRPQGPERTPALYEKLLPYAIALDLEERWSEHFAAVLANAAEAGRGWAPAWYHGDFGDGGWSPAALAGSIGNSLGGALSSSSSAPGSRSGGGGGGSSGGGGGGGGGGGW